MEKEGGEMKSQHKNNIPFHMFLTFTLRFTIYGENHTNKLPYIYYSNGSKFWYKKGKLHRDDGPAIIYNSSGTKDWYYEGVYMTEKQWKKKVGK